MTCDYGNQGPGLGQAQQCGGVKPVNVIYQIHVVSITGDHVCCLLFMILSYLHCNSNKI
jgi:hypothetical protein